MHATALLTATRSLEHELIIQSKLQLRHSTEEGLHLRCGECSGNERSNESQAPITFTAPTISEFRTVPLLDTFRHGRNIKCIREFYSVIVTAAHQQIQFLDHIEEDLVLPVLDPFGSPRNSICHRNGRPRRGFVAVALLGDKPATIGRWLWCKRKVPDSVVEQRSVH